MPDLLSDSDIQNLTLLAALKTDKAMGERIEKMLEAHKAIQATLEEVRQERLAAQEARDEGRQALAEAKRLDAAATERHAELDRREQGLGNAITGHNATVESFNKIRQQIEDDLAARTAALEINEADYRRRTAELAAKEQSVQRVHEEVVFYRDSLRRRHARLELAMAANAGEEAGNE